MSIDRGAHRQAAEGDASVAVQLTRLTKAVYRHTSEAELGMRYRQFVALAYLRTNPRISQHELGQAMLVDANNLVIVLNELESAGYALRTRDPEDRRRHLVEITAEGVEAFEQAEEVIAGVEDVVLAGLNAAERGELGRLLARAVDGASLAAASN